MDLFSYGIPLGTYWGIEVRLHFTFLLYAWWLVQGQGDWVYGLAVVAGLYFCILLHEFGHALAARWCDGECDQILLWPLGGLAYCRPAFHPTAHLITTLAGPFVSLVLWIVFRELSHLFLHFDAPGIVIRYAATMWWMNRWLFLFNMLTPAFPMDCGRAIRDTLWHWMSAETATKIAVGLSRLLASAAVGVGVLELTGLVSFSFIPLSPFSLIIMGVFILSQAAHEQQIVGAEAMGTYQFSLRERLRRGSRRRTFRRGVAERQQAHTETAFHHCATCGMTERDDSVMEFRVCPDCGDGQEYCRDHLDAHAHV